MKKILLLFLGIVVISLGCVEQKSIEQEKSLKDADMRFLSMDFLPLQGNMTWESECELCKDMKGEYCRRDIEMQLYFSDAIKNDYSKPSINCKKIIDDHIYEEELAPYINNQNENTVKVLLITYDNKLYPDGNRFDMSHTVTICCGFKPNSMQVCKTINTDVKC